MADTYALLAAVLAAVEDGFTAAGVDLPDRRYVSHTLPAHDCEQVTVYGPRRFPHTGDMSIEQPSPYAVLWQEGLTVEIDIVRCAPEMGEDGSAPSVAALDAASVVLYRDSDLVFSSIVDAVESGDLPGCEGAVWLGWQNGAADGGLMFGVSTVNLSRSD